MCKFVSVRISYSSLRCKGSYCINTLFVVSLWKLVLHASMTSSTQSNIGPTTGVSLGPDYLFVQPIEDWSRVQETSLKRVLGHKWICIFPFYIVSIKQQGKSTWMTTYFWRFWSTQPKNWQFTTNAVPVCADYIIRYAFILYHLLLTGVK